jgi:hypothetical protein
MSEEARAYAFAFLREHEPDCHLLKCPDTVVIEGDRHPRRPCPEGGWWVTLVLSMQCGHGVEASKLTVLARVMPEVPNTPQG